MGSHGGYTMGGSSIAMVSGQYYSSVWKLYKLLILEINNGTVIDILGGVIFYI